MSTAFKSLPYRKTVLHAVIAATLGTALTACGGGGSDGITLPGESTPTPVPSTAPVNAAKLNLSWDKTSIKSGGVDKATLTITALDKSNGIQAGATVLISSTSGILSSTVVTTDAKGQATVTYSAGNDDTNRTETITVSSGSISNPTAIKVAGTTLTLASGNPSVAAGSTTTVTATIKDGAGNLVTDADVVFSATGSGSVTFSPATVKTDENGVAQTTVTGGASGSSTVTATSLGTSKTTLINVTGGATGFRITSPTSAAVTVIQNTSQVITVSSTSTNVDFTTTLGTLTGITAGGSKTASTLTIPVIGGVATATLNTPTIGNATIQASPTGSSSIFSTLNVIVSPAISNNSTVTIQAQPAVVAPSSGGQTNSITLKAKVFDSGAPVANVPVMFSLANTVGGGEYISPAVAYSGNGLNGTVLGEAQATFYSGSVSSGQTGIQASAKISLPNGSIQSGTTNITIGGSAGSVSIGEPTKISSSADNTLYLMPMSIIVADSNGNPMANTVVNLSAWPVYFSTGTSCSVGATFTGEDANENLFLDAGEDGNSIRVGNSSFTAIADTTPVPIDSFTSFTPTSITRILDGKLTPINSAAGTVPATVTTDSNGVASFTYTYQKSNAIWTVVRIKANTLVQGTETTGQKIFRLRPTIDDAGIGGNCFISDSPYNSVIKFN